MPPSPLPARRIAVLVTTVCAAGLALVLPAGAGAFEWQFPVTPLQAGSDGADSADVAVSADGTTTIVYAWRYRDNLFQSSWIKAATRPPGQSDFIYWDVSIPFVAGDGNPRIAVSPDGTTTVVWRDGGTDQLWVTTRPPGQSRFPDPTQTPPQRLSDPTLSADSPEVTAADDGSVTVVWDAINPNPYGARRVQAATRLPGQAGFGAAITLSTPGPSNNFIPLFPQVAAGPDGTTTVVWSRFDNANVGTVQAATRRPGQSVFDVPQDVSTPGETSRSPDVAFGADGQTTVVWQGQDQAETVEAAVRQPGAPTFDAPQFIAGSNGDPAAQVAYAPDGRATVVWGYSEVFSSTRGANSGNWGPATPVSGPIGGANQFARIVVADDGRATVAWLNGYAQPAAKVLAASRPGDSGEWSSPVVLDGDPGPGISSPWATPAIAVAPDGRATVAWTTKALRPGTNPAQGVILTIDSDATSYALDVKTGGTGSGTITSTPSGINCGATCSSAFPLSTPVVLTANPSAGSSFSGWGGACSGSESTCTVRILGDRSVTATFTRNPPAPAPGPAPSNSFTTTSSAVRGSTIVTRVTVPGPGTITQRATYSPRRASSTATRTACTASRTATKAGTYALICRLNPATREQRRKGTLRVRLRTTFTPTGGTPRASVRTVVVRTLTLPVVG